MTTSKETHAVFVSLFPLQLSLSFSSRDVSYLCPALIGKPSWWGVQVRGELHLLFSSFLSYRLPIAASFVVGRIQDDKYLFTTLIMA